MSRLNSSSFDGPAWEAVTRGECQRKLGKYFDAVATFTTAIETFTPNSPNAAVVETFICRGAARGQSGDHAAAIPDFSSAIELDPKSALAYYNRGYSHERLGEFSLAIDDYSRAIELQETDVDAYLRRGVCLKRLNDAVGARRDFGTVRRLRKRKT